MTNGKLVLTEQETQALQARYDRTKEGALRSRMQAVWIYQVGYSVAEITN